MPRAGRYITVVTLEMVTKMVIHPSFPEVSL
jgi:hypothetical protein